MQLTMFLMILGGGKARTYADRTFIP